ncbi:hypothetical protein TIFTF001_018280 [Ficus carica]|uniref:Uncharacterized protein n=1 Tax=Ficus carica TaxID=3494 RepID=A0AA88D939_FICCA|nr:hypothetical protein TIFTF001_018280 [Ficus carica]
MFSSKEEVKFTPNGTNLGTSQRENNVNDMCGSSGNDNVIGRLSDNLDEASSSSTTTSMIFQSDSSIIGNAFSEGRVKECHWFSENDFQHYGIDTTEHLLSWDGFNSFDDVSSVGDIYN